MVKTVVLEVTSIPGKNGATIAKPNQNTEKLIKKSAKTEINAGSNFLTK